jgi:hypothetical protein
MSTSLYDISVPSYLQVLGGVASVMQKTADHYQENGMDLGELVSKQLQPDMLPFSFQINSVKHHSLGAIEGLQRGELNPPPSLGELDFAGLQGLVSDAIAGLEALDAEQVNAMSGKEVFFRMGDFEIPFTAENFVLSFSLPNLHFHATTAYDMARISGVQIGKMDYLGQMRVGA